MLGFSVVIGNYETRIDSFFSDRNMSSYAPDQCSICRTSLNSKEFDEITTSCGHTFHRECAQKRLDRYNKTDCQVCRRDRALGDALSRQKIPPPETVSYMHLVEREGLKYF